LLFRPFLFSIKKSKEKRKPKKAREKSEEEKRKPKLAKLAKLALWTCQNLYGKLPPPPHPFFL
jgi:hypothetical protein